MAGVSVDDITPIYVATGIFITCIIIVTIFMYYCYDFYDHFKFVSSMSVFQE